MTPRTIALSTMLVSLLTLAGCAGGVPPAASAPGYPILGFASPAEAAADPTVSPRCEEDRLPPRLLVVTETWAR